MRGRTQQTTSSVRQAERDREYQAACEQFGIEPALPKYETKKARADAADLDAIRCGDKGDHLEKPDRQESGRNPSWTYFDDEEPASEISADYRRGFMKALAIIQPDAKQANAFERIAGRRCVVLAWLMGRGSLAGQSLAKIAESLECSRASLSLHARTLERETGFHGRGQRRTGTIQIFRESRNAYVATPEGQAEIAAKKAATAERRRIAAEAKLAEKEARLAAEG